MHAKKVICLFLVLYVLFIPFMQLPTAQAASEYSLYFSTFSSGTWSTAVQVVSGLAANATRDSWQRKVAYGGSYYYTAWYNETATAIQYASSPTGSTWTWQANITARTPYLGGNIDFALNKGTVDASGQNFSLAATVITESGSNSRWYTFNMTGATLTAGTPATLASVTSVGGSICPNLSGAYNFMLFNRNTTGAPYVRLTLQRAAMISDYIGNAVTNSTLSGGNQILPYKTSSPYDMLTLTKGGDNVLYWNKVNQSSALFWNASGCIALDNMQAGFSDFCAASEAQNIGDPERVHLIYNDNSGNLLYRKFESDAWSSATNITSGATYPTIGIDASGNLVVSYKKLSTVCYMVYSSGVWGSEQTLAGYYENAGYLSTNQNVQYGKLCLVWTATATSPPRSNTYPIYTNIHGAIVLAAFGWVVIVGVAIWKFDIHGTLDAVLLGTVLMFALFVILVVVSAFQGVTG